MKLYSRAWVRRLQRSNALPALPWYQWLRRFCPDQGWLRLIIPLYLVAAGRTAPGSEGSLHLLTGWLLMLLLFRVWQIPDFLLFPRAAYPLLSLPVNDAFAFAFSRNRLIRHSSWIAVDTFAFFLGALGCHSFWPGIAQLTGVALLLWAIHLSLALLLAYFIWSAPERLQRYLSWGLLLSLLTLGVVLFGNLTEKRKTFFSPALAVANGALQERTPMGWSTSWARWSLSPGDFPTPPAATVGGLAILLFSAPWSYRALRRRFAFRGSDDAETLLSEPDEESQEDHLPPSPKEAPALVESVVLRRNWLLLPDERESGWLERLIYKSCSPRQKALAFDLVHHGNTNWGRSLIRSYLLLAFASLISFLLIGTWQPASIGWLFGISGVIALAMQIPPLSGGIPGMETPAFLSNGSTALTSLLPVGISELRALFIRAAYFRHLPALPTFLWLGVCFSAFNSGSWTGGLFPAFVLWLASLAIAPCWFIFKISPQTRDTRSSFWLTGTIFGAGFLGAGLLVALFFISLNSPWWFSFVHLLLLALYVRGFEALYLRWYRRGRFDLIAAIQSS